MSPGKTALKMLCSARLDETDEEIFEKAARPGEWAIPGSFEFLHDDDATLSGKRLQAFRAGFLGLTSFGRSTIVSISPATEDQILEAIERLSRHLMDEYDAPDQAAARHAARTEIEYAQSLCQYEIGTLIAVERELSAEGVEETFKRFIPSQAVDWENAKPISLADLVKQDDL